jgi:hypothetical protein
MRSGRLCCPYLLLSRADNASREHDLRAIFNAVRYVVNGGNQWLLMPNDLPPWPAAYQQMQRWMRAGCFERIVEDVQLLLRQFLISPNGAIGDAGQHVPSITFGIEPVELGCSDQSCKSPRRSLHHYRSLRKETSSFYPEFRN